MVSVAYHIAHNNSDFGHMGWEDGAWWMMLFWGPVLTIAAVALIVWIVRSSPRSGGGPRTEDAPLDGARRILAERFARGEIDSDEYRERLERLG